MVRDLLLTRTRSLLVVGLLGLAFFWALTTRVATSVSIGGYTLNAYLTFVAALLASLLFLLTVISLTQLRNQLAQLAKSLGAVTVVAVVSSLPFFAYSLISLAQSQLLVGLQNTLVWVIFSLFLVGFIFNSTESHLKLVSQGLLVAAILLPASKIVSTLVEFDFQGQSAYAITALVLLAWAVSIRPLNWIHHAIPWLIFISILMAGVRMAGVTAALFMLFLVRHLPLSRLGRLLSILPLAGVGALLVWRFLGDKFVYRVAQGIELVQAGNPSLGYLEIVGTSERGPGWIQLVDSLGGDPNVWGQGAGKTTVFFLTDYPIGHAHNEYLRIFYDFGWVGLLIFLGGALSLFVATAMLHKREPSEFSFAALLTIFAVAVLSLTDNPIVYVMTMLPAAVIIASGFARARLKNKTLV